MAPTPKWQFDEDAAEVKLVLVDDSTRYDGYGGFTFRVITRPEWEESQLDDAIDWARQRVAVNDPPKIRFIGRKSQEVAVVRHEDLDPEFVAYVSSRLKKR